MITQNTNSDQDIELIFSSLRYSLEADTFNDFENQLNTRIQEKDAELHEICEDSSLLFLDCLKNFTDLDSNISTCKDNIVQFTDDLQSFMKSLIYNKKLTLTKERALENIQTSLYFLKQFDDCLTLVNKASDFVSSGKHINAMKILKDIQGKSILKNPDFVNFRPFIEEKIDHISQQVAAKAKDYFDSWSLSINEKQQEISRVIGKLIEDGNPLMGSSFRASIRKENSIGNDRDKLLLQRNSLINRNSLTLNVRDTLQFRRTLQRSSIGGSSSLDAIFNDFKIDIFMLEHYQSIMDQISKHPEGVKKEIKNLREEQFRLLTNIRGLNLENIRIFFIGIVGFLFIQKEIEVSYDVNMLQIFWGKVTKLQPEIIRTIILSIASFDEILQLRNELNVFNYCTRILGFPDQTLFINELLQGDNFTIFTNKILDLNKEKVMKTFPDIGFQKMIVKNFTEYDLLIKTFEFDEDSTEIELLRIVGKAFQNKEYPFSRFVPFLFEIIKDYIDLVICSLGDSLLLKENLSKQTCRVASELCYSFQEAVEKQMLKGLAVHQLASIDNDLGIIIDHLSFVDKYLETKTRSPNMKVNDIAKPHFEQFKLKNYDQITTLATNNIEKMVKNYGEIVWNPKDKANQETAATNKIMNYLMESFIPMMNWNKLLIPPLLMISYKEVIKGIWDALRLTKNFNVLGVLILQTDIAYIEKMTGMILIDFDAQTKESTQKKFFSLSQILSRLDVHEFTELIGSLPFS